jgi:hypothetical protein
LQFAKKALYIVELISVSFGSNIKLIASVVSIACRGVVTHIASKGKEKGA